MNINPQVIDNTVKNKNTVKNDNTVVYDNTAKAANTLSYKKWSVTFVLFFTITCLVCMAFNYVIDPFGVFGDAYLKMYSYNMSKNMRTAKITYLEKNYEKFDSYIIGGSKSGSLMPESAEKYYPGSHFYNLNMIGGKFYDYEQTIKYVVDNFKVKNIILQISQLELDQVGTSNAPTGMLHGKVVSQYPLLFYARFLFLNPSYAIEKLQTAVKWTEEFKAAYFYNIENGAYNRAKEEKQIITNPDSIFGDKSRFPDKTTKISGSALSYNLASLKRIVGFCRDKGVKLLVVTAPTYKTELETFPLKEFGKYMKDIAGITDYWNFSGYNSVNTDITRFYDDNHFRVAVGDMMMGRIFGDTSVEVPDDFGTLVTPENAENIIDQALEKAE